MNLFDLLITQPIFNLLLFIYNFTNDFGLAIIFFTIIVKLLMWPMIKSQLHQSKIMAQIQPELKEIKRRNKNNKQMETLEMMDLYKRHNINPFRSILLLFIQIPIFITMVNVVGIMTVNKQQISKFIYDFVKNLPTVSAIIENPDSFTPKFLSVIDLSVKALPLISLSAYFIMAVSILSALLQWYMIKQQQPSGKNRRRLRDIMNEAAEGKEADQAEINQIVSGQMSFMIPLMLFVTSVNLAGVFAFYYLISNIIQVIQQKYVYSLDEKEMKEIANTPVSTQKKSQSAKSGDNIRRIKAKDTKRRSKR